MELLYLLVTHSTTKMTITFYKMFAECHKYNDSSNLLLLLKNCICTCLFLALIVIQICNIIKLHGVFPFLPIFGN